MAMESVFELGVVIKAMDFLTGPLKAMAGTLKSTQSQFDGINNTMKLMGKSKAEIDAINSSLQRMADQKAFSNMASDLKKIGMAKEDIAAMEASYMKMAQYQRDMAKAQAEYATGKDLAMSGVGNLTTGAMGAFGIFELVKQAGEFQANMTVIQDSTGASAKQMQAFSDAVMNTSAAVSKFNDMQVAQIAQTLTSGGFGNIKEAQGLLTPVAKYAESQMYEHKASDPIESTKQAIEMAHLFGHYDAKSFEGFLNDFNKYSLMQPGDSTQLEQTLKYLAPTAQTMHMKEPDIMALAALDNTLGLSGSHGGTNSADMILRLIPGLVGGGPKFTKDKKGNITEKDPKAWKAMKELGFIDDKGNSKFFDSKGNLTDLNGMITTMIDDGKKFNPKDLMAKYKDIFGIQGGNAASILANPRSLEQLGKMKKQLGKTKSMEEINNDLQKTPEGQLNLLKSNSMTLMLRVGQQLAISLNPAITSINKVLSSMLKFSEAHPQVAKLVGDFALFAVGGKLAQGVIKILAGNIKMAGAALKMFKLTKEAGELTRFGKVVSGIGKAIKGIGKGGAGAFKFLGKGTVSSVKALGSALKTVGSAGAKAFKFLGKGTLSALKSLGSGTLSVVKILGRFGVALARLGIQAAAWAIRMAASWLIAMGPVGWIIAGVTAVLALFVVAWKNDWGHIREHTAQAISFIKSHLDLILAAFGPLGMAVAVLMKAWQTNFGGIRDTTMKVVNDIKKFFNDLFHGDLQKLPGDMLKLGGDIINGLKNGIQAALGGLKTVVTNIGSTISSTFKSIMGIHSPSRVFMQHGKFLVQGLAIGIAQNAKMAHKSMVALAKGVNSSFNSAGNSVSLAGNGGAPIEIHIHPHPHQRAEEIADLAIQKMGKVSRRMAMNTGTTVNMGAM